MAPGVRGYLPLVVAEESPQAVRTAVCLAPCGMGMLLLGALIASSVNVCTDVCVRDGDGLEDKLLQCMDHCEVQSDTAKPAGGCESKCNTKIGFTRRQVRHRQEICEKDCESYPTLLRLVSLIGAVCLMPVTPLLASYKDSCHCECCVGEGCSQRLAFYSVAWFFFGFSCLWVLPTVLEDADEVGGKVLFGLTQGISMASMGASRTSAAKQVRRIGTPAVVPAVPAHAVVARGVNGVHPTGTIVGQPVAAGSFGGPSTVELQAEVQQLKQQVERLTAALSKGHPEPTTAIAGGTMSAGAATDLSML